MRVETRFDIGDKVYVLHKNSVETTEILGISIEIDDKEQLIKYEVDIRVHIVDAPRIDIHETIEESRVFKTKEELIKSL
jgi:hypothetical protein